MSQIRTANLTSEKPLDESVLNSDKPLLLKGLIRTWPLVDSGAKSVSSACEYIKSFYGNRLVGAFRAEPEYEGRFFYNDDINGMNFTSEHRRLDDVLEDIEKCKGNSKPPSFYVGSTSVDTCLPGFREDNDLNFGGIRPLVSIWLGNQSRIAAHYDAPNNIACNAVGRRRFTLFPPDQIKNLYVGPIDFTPAGQSASMVDFLKPDFDKFPRFKEALKHAVTIELEPGDAIFIPSMWWHHVEGLEPFNVLVNYWWRTAPAYAGPGVSALHHAMLTLRDLPDPERQAWKALFDYYIFDNIENSTEHIPEHARGILSRLDDTHARKLRSQLLASLNR